MKCLTHQIRFLNSDGSTRKASAEDEPYLKSLHQAVADAADGDPGEEDEEQVRREYKESLKG